MFPMSKICFISYESLRRSLKTELLKALWQLGYLPSLEQSAEENMAPHLLRFQGYLAKEQRYTGNVARSGCLELMLYSDCYQSAHKYSVNSCCNMSTAEVTAPLLALKLC